MIVVDWSRELADRTVDALALDAHGGLYVAETAPGRGLTLVRHDVGGREAWRVPLGAYAMGAQLVATTDGAVVAACQDDRTGLVAAIDAAGAERWRASFVCGGVNTTPLALARDGMDTILVIAPWRAPVEVRRFDGGGALRWGATVFDRRDMEWNAVRATGDGRGGTLVVTTATHARTAKDDPDRSPPVTFAALRSATGASATTWTPAILYPASVEAIADGFRLERMTPTGLASEELRLDGTTQPGRPVPDEATLPPTRLDVAALVPDGDGAFIAASFGGRLVLGTHPPIESTNRTSAHEEVIYDARNEWRVETDVVYGRLRRSGDVHWIFRAGGRGNDVVRAAAEASGHLALAMTSDGDGTFAGHHGKLARGATLLVVLTAQ